MIGDTAVIAVGSVEIRNIPADIWGSCNLVHIFQKQSSIKNETNLFLFRFFIGKIIFLSYLTVAKGVMTE